MVRKFIFVILALLFTAYFGANIYVLVDRNVSIPNVSEFLSKFEDIFSNVPPNTVRVVQIIDFEKETFNYKKAEFVYDPSG
ncbi:MAG: hypothetical protein ACP5KD_05325 [Fervidobacterium sp.]